MTIRIRSALLGAALALTALPGHAAQDEQKFASVTTGASLSLGEAIALALERAPQVEASAAAVDGAEANALAAGRLPDPELIAGVDNLPINSADQFSFTRDFMTMRKVGVMQTFPSMTKRRLRTTLAQREVDFARSQLAKSRFEAARDTANAWLALAATEESLLCLKALQPEIELQANAGRAALSSGRTPVADALEAQLLAARFEERIAALAQGHVMQQAELSRWIGTAAEQPLAAVPTTGALGAAPEALLAEVSGHAPLAPLAAEIDAARAEVDLARAEKLPDWSAELTYAKRGPEFSDMVSLEFRIGLPLFPGHRQDAAIASRLAAVRGMEAAREADIRMHRAEIESAIEVWRSGQPRLNRYVSELLPLARDRARAVLAAYRSGRGDLRSTVDALRDELDLELEYIELKGAVAGAWTFLHLLHGGAMSQ